MKQTNPQTTGLHNLSNTQWSWSIYKQIWVAKWVNVGKNNRLQMLHKTGLTYIDPINFTGINFVGKYSSRTICNMTCLPTSPNISGA